MIAALAAPIEYVIGIYSQMCLSCKKKEKLNIQFFIFLYFCQTDAISKL